MLRSSFTCRLTKGWRKSNDFKAFSLIKKEDVFSYDKGIAQGWDNPFATKIEQFGLLTEQEDNIIRGIGQMKRDIELPKHQRGG